MLEASAFQALQAQAPYRGIIKPPVELVVHDFGWAEQFFAARPLKSRVDGAVEGTIRYKKNGKYIDIAPDGSIVSFGKQYR